MDELAAKIESEIRNRGPISFARFMELALYCPVYGYYEKEGDSIGREGDYYTSVSVGNLFGRLLAWKFSEWFAAAESTGHSGAAARAPRAKTLRLIEAGAHRGALARDILEWFQRQRPELLEQLEYWIVEPSVLRRQWQQETLTAFSRNVHWARQFSELAGQPAAELKCYQIIFANELLDAMPVHRLGWDATRKVWFEWGVTMQEQQFAWTRMALEGFSGEAGLLKPVSQARAPAQILQQLIDRLIAEDSPRTATGDDLAVCTARLLEVLPDGFTIELSPAAEAWWRTAAASLQSGKLVAIDYGYDLDEVIQSHRAAGSLRTYRRHQPGRSPLDTPGSQDITADLDFSLIQNAGESLGLNTDCLISQARFLTGIVSRVWNTAEVFGAWTPQDTRQFQTLTHPDHLGRAFKVLVQSRQVVAP